MRFALSERDKLKDPPLGRRQKVHGARASLVEQLVAGLRGSELVEVGVCASSFVKSSTQMSFCRAKSFGIANRGIRVAQHDDDCQSLVRAQLRQH